MKTSSKWLFLLLLGLVVSVRIWMIAQAPSAFGIDPGDVHPDQGVVVLMAKHILEGGEFPIFHYGQAYLGSLEAFLLSICYLLFGINFWVIHIVPVLCFTIFSFAIFLLAKELFGPQVGLWSLLWCIFAPISLSEYSIMPQLGNITAPLFGTVGLYLTIKSIKSSDLVTKRWGYGLLGLMGGIGWWTSPMMIYYLITIPIFILLKERWSEIFKGGPGGVLLFFVGALPFFYYYASDPQTRVLSMGEGYSLGNLKEGLPLFFLDRIHYFLDLDKFASLDRIIFWIGASVYFGATAFLFWGFRRDLPYLLKPKSWLKISPGFILGLLFLVFLGILSSSVHIERNATRYFFPLASFFPIAIGYGIVYFRKSWRIIPIGLVLILFFIQMAVSWNYIKTAGPTAEARTKMIIGLINELAGKGIRRIYSWQSPGSEIINFYSKERIISSRPMGERYRPYEDILESSDRAAFLNPEDKPILSSLGVIGGSCQQEMINQFHLYRGFKPPLREYREIPKGQIRIMTSDQVNTIPKMLDRRWDTEWSSGRPKNPDMWIRIDLGKTYSLGMIRLLNQGSQHAQYAYNVEMVVSVDGVDWNRIIPENNIDLFYWDGPRIYYWELNYRWECRFGPVKARYLLIRNKEQTNRYPWNIGELYVFEDQGKQSLESFDDKFIVKKIQKLGLEKIYAGRWLSAKIREATRNKIKTIRTFTDSSFSYWPQSRVVEFGPRTGFIIDQQDQSGFEEQLIQAGIPLACEPIGRWRFYHFQKWGLEQNHLKNHKGFWWTGFGVLRVGPAVWKEFHRRGLDRWN